ncbi:Cyclopropane-fatty-acyl-phospholipid synthase [Necator americanus]|uniref:Cyclopropane-fatty-acyl-phospholipid synthase n=1 Tax=Necator americanus TaxID=51031 RepID=W2SWN9_NECAM|nr:Cyclopropane-fatty-acyl-phospholipid synthase [Necator americanus]ETN74045.1 Cyclopropane-fatty-acyl-phospholipid synthase [Necator americanus]
MVLDQKIGLGEAYMAGDWSAEPNPKEFLKLLIRARKQHKGERSRKQPLLKSLSNLIFEWMLSLVRRLVNTYRYIQHRFRDNTLKQSAKNIKDHYDLGNDMFRMFLDPSMTYSCALFPEPLEPVEQVNFEALEQAQIRKIDVLTDMLDLRPSDSVLEIGCGWGAFAVRAVKVGMNMIGKEGQSRQSHEYQLLQRKQCNWTGLTISNEQLQWAKRKVIEEDLEEKICLKYKDYRLAKGQYNKVVSIEMIEAVGQKFLTQYFRVLSDRLIPGGIAVLQGIVCPDAYYDHYCNSSDFIKKYIFPGGHMPSIGAIKSSLPGNLKIAEMKHIGRHYAVTLDHWYRYEFGQRIDKSQTIDITPSETVK